HCGHVTKSRGLRAVSELLPDINLPRSAQTELKVTQVLRYAVGLVTSALTRVPTYLFDADTCPGFEPRLVLALERAHLVLSDDDLLELDIELLVVQKGGVDERS